MIQSWEHTLSRVEHLMEEVPFTSWRELDESMKILLPPRELVQSVYLLMQESNHVFELPPAQRIMVFKHLFGLIWIDEAKDKLMERKKELSTMLKLLEDNSQGNQKFDRAIQWLRDCYDSLKGNTFPDKLDEVMKWIMQSPTIYDIGLLDTEITLQWFTLEPWLIESLGFAQDALTQYQKQWYALDAQIRAAKTALQESATQESWIQRQLQLLDQQTQKAKHLYAQLDTQIADTKKQLTAKQQELVQYKKLPFEPTLQLWLTPTSSLEEVVMRVQETIQQWKDLAYQITLLTQQQTTHQEKVVVLQQDIEALNTQVQVVSEKYTQQMFFECDKIKWPCPYVEAIKWSAVKSLKQQQEILTQQKLTKTNQLKTLQNNLDTKNILQKIEEFTQQKKQAAQLLAALHRKEILSQWEIFQQIKKHTDKFHTLLQTLQTERESIEIPDPKALEQKKILLQEQVLQIQTLKNQKQQEMTLAQDQYQGWQYLDIDQWSRVFQKLSILLNQIIELIETYREKHQKIQSYKDELKRNKELTTIFSKELMVVALQDFLPSLESVINTFLDEVVDYQIKFLTPESIDDSLELDIEIHDHHGVRQVKSLSGGQRATLKIAWILAVSSLFNGQFLFLDETITSLDAEAVARIWRLLESYMKKRDTKLLLVTHASQIQEMEMWERVVSL